MAAVSYIISVGGTLQTVTTGTAAPTSGTVEIRIDQTTSAVTDGSTTRAAKKGEIQQLIRILEEQLIQDTTIAQ